MNRIVTVVMLALAAVWGAAVAQAQERVVVLDMQQAVLNTDLAQERLGEMRREREFQANMEELERLRDDHDRMVEELQKRSADMSQEQLQAQARRIEERRSDIEHVGRKLQNAERQLLQQVAQELGTPLQRAVNELIESEGIGLVLDAGSALHATTYFDITAKVTDKINRAR